MSFEYEILKRKFAETLGWERRKERERLLLQAGCIAFGAALLLMPFHFLLGVGGLGWFVPLVLFAAALPWVWFARRRGQDHPARTVAGLDKELGLEERAVTAWELLARNDGGGAAQLVYRQTEEGLRNVDPQSLSPRRWSVTACSILPLGALWFALLWWELDRGWFEPRRLSAPAALARSVREFARELEEKARSEGLPESEKLAQELAKIAEKNLAGKSEEQLKKELAGAAQKFEPLGKSGSDREEFAAGESGQSLRDLRAEVEAAKELLNYPQTGDAKRQLDQSWLDRLSSMPQLNRQLSREPKAGQGFGQRQLEEYLARMELQVTAELDRRSLIDAQKYLEQLLQQGGGKYGEQQIAATGREGRDEPESGEKSKSAGSQAGSEPGEKTDTLEPAPPWRGASTQIKGQLGAGDSSGVPLKGKAQPGKSALPQQAVVANYRRQAEQELNSERVPEALKETVKNYFLSLGEGEK